MSDDIVPFHVDVPDADLDRLRSRLRDVRWPDREVVEDWSQGVPLAYMQEVCSYWADKYDWRKREARLNEFPHFRTEIDGLGVHFMHVESRHPNALPLVLTHGWPGSVVEFLKVIGPLSDPTAFGGDAQDAFHVVVPSLPGYGFSDKPTDTGWGVERIGSAWTQLMSRLGYGRYVAQGGDWGAIVTTAIAQRDVKHCAGIHLNMPVVIPDPETMSDLTELEQSALAGFAHYDELDSGYSKQQSTRPQTLGYALVDSPVGQAAWILEKFWSWMDCDGNPESIVTRDELLDNIMFYWVTGSGASSARLYWESFRSPNLDPVALPTGCSIFPKEIMRTSRRWAENRFSNLVYWNELDKGGHFAAFEQPDVFVDELRACFRKMRR